jgi:regulator of replication initiation timing
MFAVREEVEVLKEKISELMDRINQLEVENTILKANASQETLSQLTTATPVIITTQQSASPVVPQVPQITQQQQPAVTPQVTTQQQQQNPIANLQQPTQTTNQAPANTQQQSTS